MSLARINRIAAAVEAAGHAVIAAPTNPDLREQLFQALAEVVAPSFTPIGDQPGEMASLTRQARVWAQIVQERIMAGVGLRLTFSRPTRAEAALAANSVSFSLFTVAG